MGHCQLIVLSVVFCVVVVQGQLNGKFYRSSARGSCLACTKLCVFYTVVFATWNGTRITGPVLIYHDEIIVDPTRSLGVLTAPGALVCTSQSRPRTAWRRADHKFFNDEPQLSN